MIKIDLLNDTVAHQVTLNKPPFYLVEFNRTAALLRSMQKPLIFMLNRVSEQSS